MNKSLDINTEIDCILNDVFKDNGSDYVAKIKYYKSKKFQLRITINEKKNHLSFSFRKEIYMDHRKRPLYQAYFEKSFQFTEVKEFLHELKKEVVKIRIKDIF